MTALTAARKIQERQGRSFVVGVAAGVDCIQSGLAMLDSGYARPGRAGQGATTPLKAADAATYQVIGVFTESVTGGAGDGDEEVNVRAGVFNFVNSASIDAITDADIGKPCYVVDDQTVAKTSGQGTRPVAGVIEDVDAEGVWVAVGPQASSARRSVILPFFINQTDLLAPTNQQLVSPVVGEIIGASGIVQSAVTTGGDITFLVGVTAVDGLTLTVADAAAAGTVVSDTPTAGHASTVVSVGSRIQVAPAAAFNTAGAVNGFVEIAY